MKPDGPSPHQNLSVLHNTSAASRPTARSTAIPNGYAKKYNVDEQMFDSEKQSKPSEKMTRELHRECWMMRAKSTALIQTYRVSKRSYPMHALLSRPKQTQRSQAQRRQRSVQPHHERRALKEQPGRSGNKRVATRIDVHHAESAALPIHFPPS